MTKDSVPRRCVGLIAGRPASRINIVICVFPYTHFDIEIFTALQKSVGIFALRRNVQFPKVKGPVK
jgi:hypothetical protein